MAVYVSEHARPSGMYREAQLGPPLVSYSLSSGSTPALPNTNSDFIRVSADAASLISFNSTSTTASALTSTNALRIAANVQPEVFALPTGTSTANGAFRIQASST